VEPKTYAEVLSANFRAARARIGLGQEMVAARMRALGFSEWRYQTVGVVESGKRKLSAEEVMALAWVLEISISALMRPAEEDAEVRFRSGDCISARSVAMSATAYNDQAVTWEGANGDEPKFTPDNGEITVQVFARPRVSAAPSAPDPAFGEGQAPLADKP
jgi:hypothetical protein